jgi:hypothetical protein
MLFDEFPRSDAGRRRDDKCRNVQLVACDGKVTYWGGWGRSAGVPALRFVHVETADRPQ